MKIEQVKLDALIPYARNSRTHSDTQVAQIAASIKEFGFTNPVLIDETGSIIAGHGRVMAARKLAITDVPSIRLTHLTEAQKKAYIIADNKLALNAGWDDEMLAVELTDLKDMGFDLDLTGFSTDEIEALLAPAGTEGLTDEDAVPEVPEAPVTVLGDVWLLGKHRLLCGDSTSIDAVEKLMAGEKAVSCITDPPYSVNYEASHLQRGGDKTVHSAYHEADINPSELLDFLVILPCDLIVFSYSVNRHMYVLCDKLREGGWEVRKELIWVKDTFSFWMGAAYQQRHEPIWICTRNNASFRGNVDAKQSTVFEFARPKAHTMHPTAKPVELWEIFVLNHSNPSDLIFEPFAGSGTSIIAAEKTGRRCNAMELAPQYCDVIVQRWQEFTGQTATLEETGKPFISLKKAA